MGKVNEFQNLIEKTVDSTEVFAGEMLHVYRDNIELPNGKMATREYVKHVGAVAVVALTENGSVVMEKQYRYPARRVVTEIPAGKLEYGEDPYDCAVRELSEETGITADNIVSLGQIYPSPGFCREVLHLYLATGLHNGQAHPDAGEFLDVLRVPFDELVEDVMSGRLRDGKTVAAVLKTKIYLEGRK